MNRCLRCNQSCEGNSTFCDNCQASLLERSYQPERTLRTQRISTSQSVDVLEQNEVEIRSNSFENSVGLMLVKVAARERNLDRPVSQGLLTAHASLLASSERPTVVRPVMDDGPVRKKRIRRLFVTLLFLAVFCVVVDGALVVIASIKSRMGENLTGSGMLMVLSNNIANRGEHLTIHVTKGLSLSQLYLTRDIHEPVLTDAPLLTMDAHGEATVQILLNDTWKSGDHMLTAEDIKTHYTVSVPLHVIGPEAISAPQLQFSEHEVDFGEDMQGKNTIHSLTLSNVGSGSISWVATSQVPWLYLSPSQGIFSASQQISLAVTRNHLAAGDYEGKISFVASSGPQMTIHVKMKILPLPSSVGGVLAVTPPAISLYAIDGNNNETQPTVTVSNPGNQSLHWSLGSSTPLGTANQNMPFLSNVDWFTVARTSGDIAPGGSETLPFQIHSVSLLEGVYSRLLTFTRDQSQETQSIVVSLTVSPHCGVVAHTDRLTFTAQKGQSDPLIRNLGLAVTQDCVGSVDWKASSLSDWLQVSPANGHIQNSERATLTLTLHPEQLQEGMYNGFLVLMTDMRTQMVAIQLTVGQPDGGANGGGLTPATIVTKAVAPPHLESQTRTLQFVGKEGQPSISAQSMPIINAGEGMLYWQAKTDDVWLRVTPAKGNLAANQNVYLTIEALGKDLVAGNYVSKVTISQVDENGQVQGSTLQVLVTFVVTSPCSLESAPPNLEFSSSLFQHNPPAQTISLKHLGGCYYPIIWSATIDGESQKWLSVSPSSGSDEGRGAIMTVTVQSSNMLLGRYRGKITVTALDNQGNPVLQTPTIVSVSFDIWG